MMVTDQRASTRMSTIFVTRAEDPHLCWLFRQVLIILIICDSSGYPRYSRQYWLFSSKRLLPSVLVILVNGGHLRQYWLFSSMGVIPVSTDCSAEWGSFSLMEIIVVILINLGHGDQRWSFSPTLCAEVILTGSSHSHLTIQWSLVW